MTEPQAKFGNSRSLSIFSNRFYLFVDAVLLCLITLGVGLKGCILLAIPCHFCNARLPILDLHTLAQPVAAPTIEMANNDKFSFDSSTLPGELGAASKVDKLYLLFHDTPVFLVMGLDEAPGVAGVDDDGNGVVDDLSELGATGTDDEILTPADGDAYTVAVSSPSSRVVSHGAMLPIWSSDSPQSLQQVVQQIPVPAELRIDAIDEHGKLHSRFISLR